MVPSFVKIISSPVPSGSERQAPAHIISEAPAPTMQVVKASLDEALKFSKSSLICRFNGFFPWLEALHSWILEVWKPLISDEINIYRCATGLFIVDFENSKRRQ